MELSILQEYYIPVIIGICLCVGYVLKKWVKDLDNKFIPTISAALGLLLSIVMNWGNIDLMTILSGLVSGLAATGLHQAFKQIIEGD